MHPSMQAYIPVLGESYLQSRTDRKGAFSFNLPDTLADRSYTIRAWSEDHGWSEEKPLTISPADSLNAVTLYIKNE
jgi:hypothetical protein